VSPLGRVVMNPSGEERKCGRTDVAHGAYCPLTVGSRRRATKNPDPETEGMPTVGRFRSAPPEGEKGNEGESCADDTKEQFSPRAHTQTISRKEANERAN
jgi:hypothetical protein